MRSMKTIALAVLFAVAVFAQNDRGTVTGTVTDQAGAVIPNASVIATNSETGTEFRTSTTGTGNYTIPSLVVGTYRLTVEVTGFKKFNLEKILVQVATTNRVDISMQIGATSDTVTVTEEAAILKTETAEQSTIITSKTINELPLNFGGGGGSTGNIRSPYLFNILSPGVANNALAQGDTANVNGLPASTFRVQVDGQDATSQNDTGWTSTVAAPSVDMVQEFSLQTSNYAAEFGQAGGGFYNFTTKSGTNGFHGSAYEYFTNEAMDAAKPFTNVKPRSRKNDFGGTIGGPVWIPKIYDGRNKSFFFFNWETYRNNVQAAGTFLTVPTLQMRGGDFSQLLVGARNLGTDAAGRPIIENTIYNPASAHPVSATDSRIVTDPYAGNIIPQSQMDPVALKIQALIPLPTNNLITNNWAQNNPNYRRQQIPAVKVDQVLPDSSHLSFYFSKQSTSQLTNADGLPFPLSAVRVQAIYGTTARLNYDKSITPTLLLHSGVGYQRFHNPDSSPVESLGYDAAGKLGFKGSATDPSGFPRINFEATRALNAGMSQSPGPSNANKYYDGLFTATSTATYIRGNHTFKLGGEMRINSWTDQNTRGSQGILEFRQNQTALPYLQTSAVGVGNIGFGYASFLLGTAESASVNAVQDPQLRKKAWALYIQDTWKITRKLTLDYGLRWDLEGQGHEIHYRTSMFGPSIPNPTVGNIPGAYVYEGYGAGRCNCQFTNTYPYAIGPRLGVAYSPDSKTVLRGGFGVSYGAPPTYSYITNQATLGVGFNQIQFTNTATGFGSPAVTLSNGLNYNRADLYTASLAPGLAPTAPNQLGTFNYLLDRNARPPRILQWSIGVQREVWKGLVVEGSYVGNRSAWLNAQSLNNINAIPQSTFQKYNIDPASAAGQALLTSRIDSTAAKAAGIPLPYSTFPASQTVAQAIRPFPQVSNNVNTLWAPLGMSWYNSLQAKVTQRVRWGVSVTSAFTWSKSLANPPNGTTTTSINNVFNRDSNKSIASYDQPLVWNTAIEYETQKYTHNRLVNHITSGWTVAGLIALSSGLPIASPQSSNNQNNWYFQTTLQNRVPGVPLFLKDINGGNIDPNKDYVLNPAAWVNPAPGQWGTAAPFYTDYRYARRPAQQISVGRRFALGERRAFEIRAEFFNVMNHIYLNNPTVTAPQGVRSCTSGGTVGANGTCSAGTTGSGFGFINPSVLQTPPRNGQLVARFTF
jgi:hypothetical protein